MAPNKKQQSGKKEADPLSVVWDRLSLSTISKADFEQLTEVEQRLEFDLGVSIEHIALADLKLLKSHFGNRKLSQEIWDHLFGHCELQSVERVRQFLVLIAQLIAEPGEMQVAASAAYMELLRVENCPMWASVYRGPLLHKIVKLTCTCLKPPKDAPATNNHKKQAKKKGTASKAAAAAASGNDDHEDGRELNLSDNLDGANPGINGNETAEDREERERSESLAPLNRALLRQLVLLCDEQPLGRTIDAVGFLIEDFTKLVLEPRDEEIVDLAFTGLKGVVKWNEKYFLSDDAVQEELDARAKLQEDELRGGDLGEGGAGGGNKGILEDVLKDKEAKAAEDAKAGELEQEQRKKVRVLLQLVSVIYTGVLPVIGMFRPGRGLPQNLPKIWKYGREAGIKFVAELLGEYPLLAGKFPFEIANEDSDDEMEDETAGGVGTEEKSFAKSPGKKGGARSPGKQKLKLEEDIEMEDAFAAESPAVTKKTKKEPKSTAKKLKRGQKDIKGGKKKKDHTVVSDDDDDEEDEEALLQLPNEVEDDDPALLDVAPAAVVAVSNDADDEESSPTPRPQSPEAVLDTESFEEDFQTKIESRFEYRNSGSPAKLPRCCAYGHVFADIFLEFTACAAVVVPFPFSFSISFAPALVVSCEGGGLPPGEKFPSACSCCAAEDITCSGAACSALLISTGSATGVEGAPAFSANFCALAAASSIFCFARFFSMYHVLTPR
mmetsp:Transcript_13562/g.33331  ORF Transcript_13562/g.33331 Transcript_13562/m.33331 type:complete len:723 (-) Transcript_13562:411-2579(-)